MGTRYFNSTCYLKVIKTSWTDKVVKALTEVFPELFSIALQLQIVIGFCVWGITD